MSVHALPVPAALDRWLAGIWRHEAGGASVRVLPDGCHDILFDLEHGTARVIGPMRTAAVVRVAATARWLGVRFHPGVSALFFGALASELADASVLLAELARPALCALAEQLGEPSARSRSAALLASAFSDPHARQRATDPRLARAARRVQASHGAVAVRELARDVGVTERQLERLFLERIGLGPKLFSRIARLEHALGLLAAAEGRHAELAARAGYSDEPHFTREVRALAGLCPSELARERRVGFVQA